jgi:hypothetical protein
VSPSDGTLNIALRESTLSYSMGNRSREELAKKHKFLREASGRTRKSNAYKKPPKKQRETRGTRKRRKVPGA